MKAAKAIVALRLEITRRLGRSENMCGQRQGRTQVFKSNRLQIPAGNGYIE
jgi:hypothetical protein